MATVWSKARVVGPLAPCAQRFGQELLDLGYTDLSAAEQLQLMGHVSRWLAGRSAHGGAWISPVICHLW